MLRRILLVVWVLLMLYVLDVPEKLFAQDAATGAIRGGVTDASGARIPLAQVIVTQQETGIRRGTLTNDDGVFMARMLSPGVYTIRVAFEGMESLETNNVVVELGSEVDLKLTMRVAGAPESVTVLENGASVGTQNSEPNAEVIDEKKIRELPLNGRRFSDLALLVPGVVADPRGTSSSIGSANFCATRHSDKRQTLSRTIQSVEWISGSDECLCAEANTIGRPGVLLKNTYSFVSN